MRRVLPLLLAVACASRAGSTYVPGGADLPERAKLEYRRAVRLEQNGDKDRALAVLAELASRHPLSLGIHLRRLRLTLNHRGREAAVALYDPPPPGVDPERAAILAALAKTPDEDVAERAAILESATAREPRNPFWRLAFADVRVTAHDIVVARARREQALGNVQAAAESFEDAARLIEEARQDAETALQYDPDFEEAHLLLGFIYTRIADLATKREVADLQRGSAEPFYKRAVELDPECLAARLNRAENFLYFGEYKNAVKELLVARKLAPKEPLVWNNLGYTYYSLGYVDEAVVCYRESLRLDAGNARIRTALADGLQRMDKPDEAVRDLKRAREDAGDDKSLRAAIAFKLAAIHERQKRYREAVLEYRRHLDLDGQDSAKAESRIRAIYGGAFEK